VSYQPANRTMVTNLVLVTVAIYIVDYLLTRGGNSPEIGLANYLACTDKTLWRPWLWWQYLTYGFLHDLRSVYHVALNMFILWMFGRQVEAVYGRREFLRFYFAAIIASGIVWSVAAQFEGVSSTAVGASGGVAAVLLLYALNFPYHTILLFFVFPVPAWLFGVVMVSLDLLGMTGHLAGNVAYAAHLGGAAFGYLYYRYKWNLGKLLPRRLRTGGRRIVTQATSLGGKEKAFHRCEVCGITDRTHPDMDFRYCSKCDGQRGYCTEHIRNHEHVTAVQNAEKPASR